MRRFRDVVAVVSAVIAVLWLVTTAGSQTTITGSGSTVTQGTSPWVVTGSGTAGAAAPGVVTVQGIAGMVKLLVTPDSVALPANQSVNVSQINAVTPLMGAGNTGTGSLRITLATDQPTPTNPFLVQPQAIATGGATVTAFVAAGSTNATNLKASAGTFYSVNAWNNNAFPLFVTTYNNSGAPTCGTSIIDRFYIPPIDSGVFPASPVGSAYSSGIAYCMHTAYDGTGNATANTSGATFYYK